MTVRGNGSGLGIRRAWLPLFDKYEVDLVLSGHEHDYERTYPVRGFDAVKNGADSVEDAPWSAAINPTDAYGYSLFDVHPGRGRGETRPRSPSSAAGWAARSAASRP